ncbi:hypothetical protein MKW92_040903 [Papaver armeniacum]|nr:hypothetical protein MKW92_040903 [Papaver armeniacum]
MFCLEVSCGSGLKATIRPGSAQLRQEDSAASVSYFATDIHPHAVRVTSETLKAHTVHAEVLCDNIAASGLGKRLSGKVDVMVVNPPYVPTPEDVVMELLLLGLEGKMDGLLLTKYYLLRTNSCPTRVGCTWSH